MRSARPITLLLVLAGVASAQTFSAHSGFSFSDTLETATDVLVADVLNGAGLDNGSQVTVKAEIRAVRILKGGIPASATLNIEWRYDPTPLESPAASAKVPPVRGLWFLRRNAGGMFEALRILAMPVPFGGSFLEVSAAPPVYPPDASLQSKIAHEVGSAVEDLVARHSADLAPHRPEPPKNGVVAPWVRTQMQFDSLLMVFDSLPATATADVYRAFSTSVDTNLKLLGIVGRIGGGDTGALLELEKDLPSLASTLTAARASQHVMGVDLSGNLPAAHALGRMAVSQTTIPGFEGAFAMRVVTTRSPEFVPYLIVMLDSPDSSTRGGALMAFCNLLGPAWDQRTKPRGLWDPEMAAYCPSGAPMNDLQQEQRDVRFWKEWWQSHREQLAKTVNLPVVAAPARYNAPPPFRQITEIPLEVRFQGLLSMMGSQATHYHNETGAIVEGPPPSHDPVAALLSASDQEVWRDVVQTTSTKLAANQKRGMDVMNAARLQGTLPPREALQSLDQERQAIVRNGLQELRNRLSPEGWQGIERSMKNAGGAIMIQTAEPPK